MSENADWAQSLANRAASELIESRVVDGAARIVTPLLFPGRFDDHDAHVDNFRPS